MSLVDDPFVALLALSLAEQGLADSLDTSLWSKHMQSDQLYSENWPLAYEAYKKGWLASIDGSDYVADDDFYGVLSKLDVEFYDTGTLQPATDSGWAEGY